MHKGPIQSRTSVKCSVCGQEFSAKRKDTKYCPPCRQTTKLAICNAARDKRREDVNKQARERRQKWTQERKDAVNARIRERYATDEEFRNYKRQHAVEWARLHGGTGSVHADKRREYAKRYYQKNKDAHNQKRTARGQAQSWLGNECSFCGLEDPRVLQVHHRLPLSKGGTSDPENLVTLCRNCHAIEHWEDLPSS